MALMVMVRGNRCVSFWNGVVLFLEINVSKKQMYDGVIRIM